MNTMNWTLIGLNWTVLLKFLEMTFVLIWRYINKTELNWINCTSMAKITAQTLSLNYLNGDFVVWCCGYKIRSLLKWFNPQQHYLRALILYNFGQIFMHFKSNLHLSWLTQLLALFIYHVNELTAWSESDAEQIPRCHPEWTFKLYHMVVITLSPN